MGVELTEIFLKKPSRDKKHHLDLFPLNTPGFLQKNLKNLKKKFKTSTLSTLFYKIPILHKNFLTTNFIHSKITTTTKCPNQLTMMILKSKKKTRSRRTKKA